MQQHQRPCRRRWPRRGSSVGMFSAGEVTKPFLRRVFDRPDRSAPAGRRRRRAARRCSTNSRSRSGIMLTNSVSRRCSLRSMAMAEPSMASQRKADRRDLVDPDRPAARRHSARSTPSSSTPMIRSRRPEAMISIGRMMGEPGRSPVSSATSGNAILSATSTMSALPRQPRRGGAAASLKGASQDHRFLTSPWCRSC